MSAPISTNVRRAYERDRAQLVKQRAGALARATHFYAKYQQIAAGIAAQIEAIDAKLVTSSEPQEPPRELGPAVATSAAGAAAEEAPATILVCSFRDARCPTQQMCDDLQRCVSSGEKFARARMGDSEAPTPAGGRQPDPLDIPDFLKRSA